MKFNAALDPLMGSLTKLRLLRTLLPVPQRRWTGRELARAAGVSTAQAARDLGDFLDVGILLREVQGRSYSWRVNERHILVKEISRLLDFEAQLRDNLLRDVGELIVKTPIRRALVFGSIARGDERADSDVDLFLELKTPRDRQSVASALEKVRERVWDRYGNPVSALVYTEAETRKPKNPALLDSISQEGLRVINERVNIRGKD
jgi:predicted nucleotidyltransferase